MDIEKFKKLCKSVEGYVGLVQQGDQIAIATTQKDPGASARAVSLDPIERFLRSCKIRGTVMPFPAGPNNSLIYVVRLHRRAA